MKTIFSHIKCVNEEQLVSLKLSDVSLKFHFLTYTSIKKYSVRKIKS